MLRKLAGFVVEIAQAIFALLLIVAVALLLGANVIGAYLLGCVTVYRPDGSLRSYGFNRTRPLRGLAVSIGATIETHYREHAEARRIRSYWNRYWEAG